MVPAYNEDSRFYAPVFFGVIVGIGILLLLFGPNWGESEPTKPDWHSANCYKIPARYHGGLYCSDQETGGNHGYVNPGSMEWEVE